MPLSRRTFLRGAIATAAAISLPARVLSAEGRPSRLPNSGGSGLPAAAEAGRSGADLPTMEWTIGSPGDWAAGEVDGLVRLPEGGVALGDRAAGTYRSAIHEAPFRVDAAGVRWMARDAPPGALRIRVRASDDGRAWGAWREAAPLAHGPREADAASEIVTAGGRFVQIEVELRAVDGRRPAVSRLSLTGIAAPGPDLAAATAAATRSIGARGIGPAAPRIISRAGWGCPEPYGSPAWPPQYQPAVKVFVHHTVTANEDGNPPATVRAIWQYHARSLGWGDIGYNYLIDRHGNIYEGRYGGNDVIAGHALCYNRGSVGIALLGDFTSTDPPAAAVEALIELIAWIAYRQRIHPLQSGYFVNRVLANLCCHRDGNNGCGFVTTCPGDRLAGRLEAIRQAVWDRFPEYALAWGGHATPGRLAAGEAVSVPVTVTNLGRFAWPNTDPFPCHLGYHWYRPDGSQYVQPTEEDRRTKLPRVLSFGETVQATGWLQAPRAAGWYTLKWDLVHEGHTWFADRGNPTIDTAIEVPSAEPSRPIYGSAWLGHETPRWLAPGQTVTVRLDLKNTGSATWHQTAPNSFRVGYHWYRSDGSEVVQPATDDHRTHFPREIRTDESVTVWAPVTAPAGTGFYTLKWDVVHEGVTWFAAQGNAILDVPIEVSGELRRAFLPVIGRGR